jgi:phosphopantothenoylcysteine decarboxylase / phosphopantothenate---cysteine ligase
MGIAIANECAARGADVTLVLGPTGELVPVIIKTIAVKTAAQMYEVCVSNFGASDIAIMCAAVADYTPVNVAEEKIKKNEPVFTVELKRTEDILKKLGTLKTTKQILVGFALETENEKENALKKLESKNADFIILNSMKDEGAGFGHNSNKITIFGKDGTTHSFEKKAKEKVATDIIDTILKK